MDCFWLCCFYNIILRNLEFKAIYKFIPLVYFGFIDDYNINSPIQHHNYTFIYKQILLQLTAIIFQTTQ